MSRPSHRDRPPTTTSLPSQGAVARPATNPDANPSKPGSAPPQPFPRANVVGPAGGNQPTKP